MKKLNIKQAEYFQSGNHIMVNQKSPEKGIGHSSHVAEFYERIDLGKSTDFVELCTDALNTHNETGLTPSELKYQNRELVEALQYFVNRVDEGTIKSRTTYAYYKELLTKHQKDV